MVDEEYFFKNCYYMVYALGSRNGVGTNGVGTNGVGTNGVGTNGDVHKWDLAQMAEIQKKIRVHTLNIVPMIAS